MSNEGPSEGRSVQTSPLPIPSFPKPTRDRIDTTIGTHSGRIRAMAEPPFEISTKKETELDDSRFYLVSTYTAEDPNDAQRLRELVASIRKEGRECHLTKSGNFIRLWVR